MKKTIIAAIVLVALLSGCSSSNSREDIQNQIMSYKQQIANINKKIAELENQLGTDSLLNNNILVDTQIVRTSYYEHFITVTANVDAEKNALISPQMNGQIIGVYVQEGQTVRQGKLLAKINDDVLQSNLAQLQTSLFLADTMYQKQKMLFDQNVISEVQYLQAKNQKETLEKNIDVIKSQIAQTRIYAPFSGIIDKVDIKVGELATPGRAVFQLVNLNTMIVNADVSETYLPNLNIGNPVIITFPTYPDIKIDAKIFQKGNVIDPANRTFWLKIKFPNIDKKIKPNMLATLKMKDFEANDVLVVPTTILNKDINGWFLFVVNNENNEFIAHKKYVEIGVSDNDNTIIEKGINQGDIVINKGFNQVSDGMKVSINN